MRVVLVDDQHMVRDGLAGLLAQMDGIKLTASLASGEEAVQHARKHRIDVAVVDAYMPGMAGVEVSRRLLKLDQRIAIVILLDDVDSMVPSRFIKTGALGFLTKGSTQQELRDAIDTVYLGKRYVGADLAKAMALSMFGYQEDNPLAYLSDREMQILIKVSEGAAYQDIARELCLSPKTVSTYRYRLYEKLDVKNDVHLAHIAIRNALIRLKTPDS